MKIKLYAFVLILAFLPSLSTAEIKQKITASALAAEIDADGASIVLSRYYDTPAWTNSIMPGIESATVEWLAIAEQLHAVSDGGASEDLGLALSNALASNPFRVIPVLQRIYGGSIEALCTDSFEAELPRGGVTKYLNKIETKLNKAKTVKEKEMAAACMRGVKITRKNAKSQGLIK